MSAIVRNLNFQNQRFLQITHIFRRFTSSSSSSSSFSSSSTPTTVFSSLSEYLSKSLGFSEQESEQTCTKFARWQNCGESKVSTFYFAQNAFTVVDYLKEIGCNDAHIRQIVFSDPRILSYKVDKTLKPKIRVLHDMGFSKTDIVELISANLTFLRCGLDTPNLSTILALRQIMGCDAGVVSVIKKTQWKGVGYGGKDLATNVAFLESLGFSTQSIRKILISRPNLLFRPAGDFKDLVIKVEKELGIPRISGAFLRGLVLLNSLSETTLKSKYRVFENFGWTQSDINAIVRVHPCCLGYSEQRMKNSLNFLMKELGYEPKYLISRPLLLSYGVGTRLYPRHRILSVLKEKGFIKADYPLYNAAQLTESPFLQKFVLPFEEVHELYTQLTGCNIRLQADTDVEGDS